MAHALPPPPRRVPWSLRAVLALRGGLALAGWLVLGLGGVMAGVFARIAEPWTDPFAGGVQRAQATILAVTATGARVNEQRVHEVRFAWPADDPQHEGVSYMQGGPPAPGRVHALEWVPGDPPQARLEGMRTAPMPREVRVLYALPAVGLLLLLAAAWRGVRLAGLLSRGLVAQATCVASRPTNMRVNRQPVYALTFRFVDARGVPREAKVRTHRVGPLADGLTETVLYDPDGRRTLLWDTLPLSPQDDGAGGLAPATLGQLAPGLVTPTLVALGWAVLQQVLR